MLDDDAPVCEARMRLMDREVGKLSSNANAPEAKL